MRAADHAVIGEEGRDFPNRVVKFLFGLNRHSVGADLQREGDRGDNGIGPHQRTVAADMQIVRQGWCVGDGRSVGDGRRQRQRFRRCDGWCQCDGGREGRCRCRYHDGVDGLLAVPVQQERKHAHQQTEKDQTPASGDHLLAFLEKGDAAAFPNRVDPYDQRNDCHKCREQKARLYAGCEIHVQRFTV